MKTQHLALVTFSLTPLLITACAPPEDGGPGGGGATGDGASGSTDATGCLLLQNTSATSTSSESGCAVLVQDTTSCRADREADGLSGFWLEFSCRVDLSISGDAVIAESDGLPDTRSNYFAADDVCHEDYTGAIQNPNLIASQNYRVEFPRTPDDDGGVMRGTAVTGLALNGVAIVGDFAAPQDDIFEEARAFDRCAAHPERTGVYHYHAEPLSISNQDDAFIGVMRDGYPIYGRYDTDGSLPDLDQNGGHMGVTAHSDGASVYHYHVHEQTSTGEATAGQTQWFITSGFFKGSLGACENCGQ